MAADVVYLHLGLAKTGTTYLQEYFANNRNYLFEEYGILYPSGPANHFHFQTMFSGDPGSLLQVRREGISTNDAARKFASDFRARFEAEFEARNPKKLLISSEYFSSMPEPELIELRSYLARYGRKLKPIAYIRDPWSHSTSSAQQDIRDGKLVAPVRMGYRKGQANLIRRYKRLFGDDLIVRPYFGGAVDRTDTVADFSAILGVGEMPDKPVSAQQGNRSIGRTKASLIAELNRLWPQFNENGLYEHSAKRDEILKSIIELNIKERPILLSMKRALIIKYAAEEDFKNFYEGNFDKKKFITDYFEKNQYIEEDCTLALDYLTKVELVEIADKALQNLVELAKSNSNCRYD